MEDTMPHNPYCRTLLGPFLIAALIGIYFAQPVSAQGQNGESNVNQPEPPSFTQQPPLDRTADYSTNMVLGDINADGSLDLVVAGTEWQPNQIYLNDSQGRFSIAQPFGQSQSGSATIELGDVNGDGYLDIVAGGEYVEDEYCACSVEGRNWIYLNDGMGNFDESREFGIDAPISSIKLSDVNADGHLDIITLGADRTFSSHHDQIPHITYINDGSGNFLDDAAYEYTSGTTYMSGLSVGDVNGDTFVDIVSATSAQGYLLFANDGQGNFGKPQPLSDVDNTSWLFQLADINGDGDLDWIGEHLIYENDGTGRFGTPYPFREGDDDYANALEIGDMNGDGHLDIIMAHVTYDMDLLEIAHNVIYLNDGQGSFDASYSLDTGSIDALLPGDLNNDGYLDLVTDSVIYLNDGINRFDTVRTIAPLSEIPTTQLFGDLNSDGHVDLISSHWDQPAMIHFNDGQGSFLSVQMLTGSTLRHYPLLALGDVNSDGYLDLVTAATESGGYYAQWAALLNDREGRFSPDSAILFGVRYEGYPDFHSVLGDVNGDGFLDVVGSVMYYDEDLEEQSGLHIFLNDGQGTFTQGGYLEPDDPTILTMGQTTDFVLGDLNHDGHLDMVTLVKPDMYSVGQLGFVYLNDGQGNFHTTSPFESDANGLVDLALGDVNDDGFLDIAIGNNNQDSFKRQNHIYLNNGKGDFDIKLPYGTGQDLTGAVALEDINSDGHLDILNDNDAQNDLYYLNDGEGNFEVPAIFSQGTLTATTNSGLLLADMNNDGTVDIVRNGKVQLNNPFRHDWPRNGASQLTISQPVPTGVADGYFSPTILTDRYITITYNLPNTAGSNMGQVTAFYSLDGGGQWFLAAPTPETQTTDLSPGAHTYIWDSFQSDFYGKSDNVVIRIVAYPHPVAVNEPVNEPVNDTYLYPNQIAGPYRWGKISATSLPFRVRGSQVRVQSQDGVALPDALVYRLGPEQLANAEPIKRTDGNPYRTDSQGYLEGRGILTIDSDPQQADRLIALAPATSTTNISFTDKVRIFQTSGAVTDAGPSMISAAQKGVITLTVSPSNTLTLFDLTVSLEWDATSDGSFLADLENAFKRASEVLYDVSDGQMALGDITVYQAKKKWTSADIVIYASNGLRPRASLGGVVNTALTEDKRIGKDQRPIKNAYLPGQIRMGPNWDPFGQNKAELTQDWWRALAHELAHYLLFLPDNYVGVDSANSVITTTDCQGSFMTDAYNPSYSEFLFNIDKEGNWQKYCQQTVAAKLLTGRSDWETVRAFYPQLTSPTKTMDGPYILPLAVTQVSVISPAAELPNPPIPARNLDLRKDESIVSLRQAQGYLLKKEDGAVKEIIALGSTGAGSDRIMVRGAHAGDEVCVFEAADQSTSIGCGPIQATSTSIELKNVGAWQPTIVVSAETTRTFIITVTNVGGGYSDLQVVSAYGSPANPSDIPVCGLGPSAQSDTPSSCQVESVFANEDRTEFSVRFTLTADTVEGFVYLVGNGSDQRAITKFYVSDAWGPNMTWNDANRVMGANHRSMEAPAASGDGKVTLFNVDDIFDQTGVTSIQALTSLPDLPLWLTPVGQAYRINVGNTEPITLSVLFQYLSSDVPDGFEHTLNLYFQADGDDKWDRLPTGPSANGVDVQDNLASTRFLGAGTYALMATAQIQPFANGWNPFSYPIGTSQPVTQALASIQDSYSSIYAYQPNQPLPWDLHDATVLEPYRGLVNTLETLDFGQNYTVYITATNVITPYIGVTPRNESTKTNDGIVQAAAVSGLAQPPATYYGSLSADTYSGGEEVVAMIDGKPCGSALSQAIGDGLGYAVQVASHEQKDGCGTAGKEVFLKVGDTAIAAPQIWNTQQAWYIGSGGKGTPTSLEVVDEPRETEGEKTLYLPIVNR